MGNEVNGTVDPSGLWGWDNDFLQYGVGGLLGFHGLEVAAQGWGIQLPSGSPYLDINISGGYVVGIMGGVQIEHATGDWHLYIGGGLATPGVGGSATVAVGGVTPGWQIGGQVNTFPVAGNVGWAFGDGGGPFFEAGLGVGEGASLSCYYVF